jgi:hypothetical protein
VEAWVAGFVVAKALSNEIVTKGPYQILRSEEGYRYSGLSSTAPPPRSNAGTESAGTPGVVPVGSGSLEPTGFGASSCRLGPARQNRCRSSSRHSTRAVPSPEGSTGGDKWNEAEGEHGETGVVPM